MDSSIYGLLTDIHLGRKKSSPIIFDWQHKAFKKALKIFKDNNVTDIVILGDIFDNRINNTTFTKDNFIEHFLKPLRTKFDNVFIIIGNHDIYYKNKRECNIISTLLSDRYKNVHVIDNVKRIDNMLLVPWIVNQHDINRIVEEGLKGGILLGHLEINGFRMSSSGKTCDTGLNKDIFKNYDKVISGHFHLKDSSDNIEYLGNMMGLTWGEFHGQHGIHILKNEELEYFPLDISMYDIIKFENRVYEIDDLEKFRDKIIKIIVTEETDDELYGNLYLKLKDICFSISKHYIDSDFKNIDAEDIEDNALESIKSIEDMMAEYSDKFSPDNIDSNIFNDLCKRIYEKANQDTELTR